MKLLPCKCGGEARQRSIYRLRCSKCDYETDLCLTLGGAGADWSGLPKMVEPNRLSGAMLRSHTQRVSRPCSRSFGSRR